VTAEEADELLRELSPAPDLALPTEDYERQEGFDPELDSATDPLCTHDWGEWETVQVERCSGCFALRIEGYGPINADDVLRQLRQRVADLQREVKDDDDTIDELKEEIQKNEVHIAAQSMCIAELEAERAKEVNRRKSQVGALEQINANLEQRSKEAGETIIAHYDQFAKLEAERDARHNDYTDACKLVAEMHGQIVGMGNGPMRGVVEDVADVVADRNRLRDALEVADASLDDAVGLIDHLGGNAKRQRNARKAIDAALTEGEPDNPEFKYKIVSDIDQAELEKRVAADIDARENPKFAEGAEDERGTDTGDSARRDSGSKDQGVPDEAEAVAPDGADLYADVVGDGAGVDESPRLSGGAGPAPLKLSVDAEMLRLLDAALRGPQ